jgi:hypothetical protein
MLDRSQLFGNPEWFELELRVKSFHLKKSPWLEVVLVGWGEQSEPQQARPYMVCWVSQKAALPNLRISANME